MGGHVTKKAARSTFSVLLTPSFVLLTGITRHYLTKCVQWWIGTSATANATVTVGELVTAVCTAMVAPTNSTA